jgi:hypothetical protein
MAKVDLKDHTAWSHVQATERASKRVSSWPAWKRDATLFRESDENESRDWIEEQNVELKTLNEAIRKIA